MERFINREISWLAFNARVLQEASDPTTPLVERIKFLGIFSSNLDEFFRVRVASVNRMAKAASSARALLADNPRDILARIQSTVLAQQATFSDCYDTILGELSRYGITLASTHTFTDDQRAFVLSYFHNEVRPTLFPVMIDGLRHLPVLKDDSIYLAVRMWKDDASSPRHALIKVPTSRLSRFLVLPGTGDTTTIVLLDEVIRAGLHEIFSMFGYVRYASYIIKLTRDAELDIADDITTSIFEKMSRSLKQRKSAEPVRFVYDKTMPDDLLRLLMRKKLVQAADTTIPGGRYHNFKDFMGFPPVGPPSLRNEAAPPLPHRRIAPARSMFAAIREGDILLHYPYHSFQHFIDLMREASIDPNVTAIKITLYRVAKNSNVINALINAVRNGKDVTVVLELQARFDEEANIYWTTRLREEGVRIIHGVPGLKVHAKLCLITRRERGRLVRYASVGTGNFNESTARIYSDHTLITINREITADVAGMFAFFRRNYMTGTYTRLILAPFSIRRRMVRLIEREVANARAGKEAAITLKMNSLVDQDMIRALYAASNAGVRITCIIRGICSLIPGVPGMSGNITAISIVDKYLEHSRIFVFANGGDPEYYISSADWMSRNLDRRVEAACPILDPALKRELQDFLDIQLADNVRARILDETQSNRYKREPDKPPVRAQFAFYRHLAGADRSGDA